MSGNKNKIQQAANNNNINRSKIEKLMLKWHILIDEEDVRPVARARANQNSIEKIEIDVIGIDVSPFRFKYSARSALEEVCGVSCLCSANKFLVIFYFCVARRNKWKKNNNSSSDTSKKPRTRCTRFFNRNNNFIVHFLCCTVHSCVYLNIVIVITSEARVFSLISTLLWPMLFCYRKRIEQFTLMTL